MSECSHLLSLPIVFTSPRYPYSPSPIPSQFNLRLSATFSRNLPEMSPPVNGQRGLGLHLSEVPDHLLPGSPSYLSEIAKCREQGTGFKDFCRTTECTYPSPSPTKGHTQCTFNKNKWLRLLGQGEVGEERAWSGWGSHVPKQQTQVPRWWCWFYRILGSQETVHTGHEHKYSSVCIHHRTT